MDLRVSRVRLAAVLRTASGTLCRGRMDRPALQGLAYPVRFQAAAARSMEVGRTGEYHYENRVFPVVGDTVQRRKSARSSKKRKALLHDLRASRL